LIVLRSARLDLEGAEERDFLLEGLRAAILMAGETRQAKSANPAARQPNTNWARPIQSTAMIDRAKSLKPT
jgi:hypothetical protein